MTEPRERGGPAIRSGPLGDDWRGFRYWECLLLTATPTSQLAGDTVQKSWTFFPQGISTSLRPSLAFQHYRSHVVKDVDTIKEVDGTCIPPHKSKSPSTSPQNCHHHFQKSPSYLIESSKSSGRTTNTRFNLLAIKSCKTRSQPPFHWNQKRRNPCRLSSGTVFNKPLDFFDFLHHISPIVVFLIVPQTDNFTPATSDDISPLKNRKSPNLNNIGNQIIKLLPKNLISYLSGIIIISTTFPFHENIRQ